MRKPIHFVTKTEDYDDMKDILNICERTDNVKYLFGGGTFFINNKISAQGRAGRSDMEVEVLENCLRRHIWAHKNTAFVTLRGVKSLDGKSRIRKLLTDELGDLCMDDEYQVDQEMSLRDVMMKIKVGNTPVFCLVARKEASHVAFHRNIYDEVKKYVKRFEGDPAAHIMFWLLRRGIEEDDVVDFLKMAFDAEEVAVALDTKMENGIIISKRALEQEKLIARFDQANPNIDITQAMREAEVTDYNKKLVESLKETAFDGRVGLSLDEKNAKWGSGSTIYSERNLTLGETEFNFQDWDNVADNFKDNFAKPTWDEDEVFKLNIDISKVPELEKNKPSDSSSEGGEDNSSVGRSKRIVQQVIPKSALRNNKLKQSEGYDKIRILSRANQEEKNDSKVRESNMTETVVGTDRADEENVKGLEQAAIEDSSNPRTTEQLEGIGLDPDRDEEAQDKEEDLMVMRGGGGEEGGAVLWQASSRTRWDEEGRCGIIQIMKKADINKALVKRSEEYYIVRDDSDQNAEADGLSEPTIVSSLTDTSTSNSEETRNPTAITVDLTIIPSERAYNANKDPTRASNNPGLTVLGSESDKNNKEQKYPDPCNYDEAYGVGERME
jgi:hypothetical protein